MKKSEIQKVVSMTVLGLLGSILIGYIFYGSDIFNYQKQVFQFVMSGFYGALFFSLLNLLKRNALILAIFAIIIFHITVFVGKSISIPVLILHVFHIVGLLFSMQLYYLFIAKNSHIPLYIRSLALAFIYSSCYVLIATLVYLINTPQGFPLVDYLILFVKYGSLIGFGIGIGLDSYFILEDKNHRTIVHKVS